MHCCFVSGESYVFPKSYVHPRKGWLNSCMVSWQQKSGATGKTQRNMANVGQFGNAELIDNDIEQYLDT